MADSKKTQAITITERQAEMIRKLWDKKDLLTLARLVFNNDKINGHHAEARAIKKWIAENIGADAKVRTTADAIGLPYLDEAARELIKNNPETKPLELAKLVFTGKNITYTCNEYRSVYNYLLEVNPCYISPEDRLANDIEYKQVTSIARLVPRVNKYIMSKEKENKKFIDVENVKPDEMRNLTALLTYVSAFRYVQQMNRFSREVDRELMESNYIGFTYDKPDLLPEELDSYISLCAEIVNCSQLDKLIQLYDQKIHEDLTMNDGNRKVNLGDVEQLGKLRDSLKDAKKQVETLKKSLIGARNDREDQRKQENASVWHLLEAFKNEETRKEIIENGKQQRELEGEEIEKLSNMDAIEALIAGQGKFQARFR